MTEAFPKLDVDELAHDLHGEELGDGAALRCDFCATPLATDSQVNFDVIRSHDMANLEAIYGPLDHWMADAARCAECDIESISPATDGWEEALISCAVSEQGGVLSVDSIDLTVLDHSPGPDGAHPPGFAPETVPHAGFGFARWAFIKQVLATTDADVPLLNAHADALDQIEAGVWPGSD